jgi:hypothetical protein
MRVVGYLYARSRFLLVKSCGAPPYFLANYK